MRASTAQGRGSGSRLGHLAPCLVLLVAVGAAPASAESFTLVQSTSLTGITGPSGLEWHQSTQRFYVLNGAGSTNQLYPVELDGTVGTGFSPGWTGQNFSQGGITTDPLTDDLLVLRDLSPPIFGPGAEIFSVDPVAQTGALDITLDPVTTGEVNGIAIRPGSGTILVTEVVDGSTSQILELTRAGAFVQTLVTDAQLDALGLYLGEAGLAIYPLTNELVFASNGGVNEGELIALDLSALTTRPFFDSGLAGASGVAFGPTGDLAMIDFDNDMLRLYDGDGDGMFTAVPEPGTGSLVLLALLQLGFAARRSH